MNLTHALRRRYQRPYSTGQSLTLVVADLAMLIIAPLVYWLVSAGMLTGEAASAAVLFVGLATRYARLRRDAAAPVQALEALASELWAGPVRAERDATTDRFVALLEDTPVGSGATLHEALLDACREVPRFPPQRRKRPSGSLAGVLLVLLASGCGTVLGAGLPEEITWPCPVQPIERLRDTETRIECPSNGRRIVIPHPAVNPAVRP